MNATVDRDHDEPTKARRWSLRRTGIALAACLTLTGACLVTLKLAETSASASSNGRSIVGAPRAAATSAGSAPTSTASVASAPVRGGFPDQTATPPIPSAVADQLANLAASCHLLEQQQAEADQRLRWLEAGAQRLSAQLEERQAAHVQARQHARKRALRPLPAQSAVLTAADVRPRLLSVDTWNGQPSISVLVGSEVRFASEGDVVANALVGKSDPVTQQVDFVAVTAVGGRKTAGVKGEDR